MIGIKGKIVFGVLIAVGLLMVIIGSVILAVVVPKTLKEKIAESLELRNGSEAADRFIKSPVPSYIKFYFFNVTNKDEVNTKKGVKPVFKEAGPYVYRQNKVKENLEFDEKKGTVSYKERTTYSFEKGMTNGKLDDILNLVNALSIGMATHPIIQILVKDFTTTVPKDYIDTHTVDEFLFGGFDATEYLPKSLSPDIACGLIGPNCKSGLYLGKENTVSDLYMVSSGVQGMHNYGEIIMFDKKEKLTTWQKYGRCNDINGTDGKQFPPDVDKDEGLYVFSSDVCRSFALQFQEEVVVEGIDALRYAIPQRVFANPNCNEDNMCFCPVKEYEVCPSKAGVFDVSNCKGFKDKPVAMSAPHFYMGEKAYVDLFQGLNPNKKEHQTFIDIEPLTGTAVRAAKRLQVNIKVLPVPPGFIIPVLKNVERPMYFPVMWIEEGAEIDEKSAKEFRSKVTNPYKSTKWGLVACIAIGGVILLLVPVIAFFMSR